MEKHVFAVMDSAVGAFMDPFVAPSVNFATREFGRAVNTDGTQFNQYPEDYILFYIGQFDPMTGVLIPQDAVSLGVAITFVNPAGPVLADMEDAANA